MKRAIGILCLIIAVAALATLDYSLYIAFHIGTCASGTTYYQISRPCPPGSGSVVAAIPISIVVGIASAVGAATALGLRAATALWAALFIPIGIMFAFVAHGNGGVGVVFYGLAAMFVVMGAAPLFMSAKALS